MSEPITILGAGVVGLSVATELTSRSVPVQIVDPNGPPAEHMCSWWAGGMLAPFCEGESAEEPIVRFGRKAADWWAAQGAAVTHAGSLVVAMGRDRRELDRFARRTSNMVPIGQDQIAALEPDLAGRVPAALYVAEEAHLNPRAALATLTQRLAARGVVVSNALGDTTDVQTIIDCRGLAARDALPDLRGVKGEMLVLRCADIALTRPVRLLHPRMPLYIVPRGDGVFMLGATVIEADDRDRISARGMLELLSAAYALHPAFAEAEILEIGTDARPAFPDNLPRIRRVGTTIYANGLYRHGFLLAPAMAQQVADLVTANIQGEFVDDHRPERGAA